MAEETAGGIPGDQPSRPTALRCCFALRLSVSEADELLRKAGSALSRDSRADLVLMYCLLCELGENTLD